MDPVDDHPGRLESDQDEVTYTDAKGVIRCSAHHDDWVDTAWYNEDGVNQGRSIVYRDTTWATPVPNVLWLLMEPAYHEIRRRSWVCFSITLAFVNYKLCMYAINCVCLCLVFVFYNMFACYECIY